MKTFELEGKGREATPIMIPSMVRKDLILLLLMLFKASLKDCSIFVHISVEINLPVMNPHHPLCL